VFPTRNIVNFLINVTFLTATYLSKAQYSLFEAVSAVKPQSINHIIEGKFKGELI